MKIETREKGIKGVKRENNGKKTKRIYLDTTASSLMMGVAYRASNEFLRHYSNSIVLGGFDVISYTTLLMPGTPLTILFEILSKKSFGKLK